MYSGVVLRDDDTTIVVKNAVGTPLPDTGGPGTNRIYLVGVMLIALAMTYLMLIRKLYRY